VFVTAHDALRISRELGLPLGEFATLMSFGAEEVRCYEPEHVPLRFADTPEDRRYLLALKRTESALFPGTQRCWFLQEWRREKEAPERGEHPGRHTIGRCGIYGSRPQVCRVFPTSLHATLPLALIHPQPLPGSANGCPEEWSVEKLGVAPHAAVHALAVHRFEREFFMQASREFNAARLPLAEFFPFMTRVLGHRLRVAPENA
jgi:Fe-S-cluster containining protein